MKKDGLISNGYHIPYNPRLQDRARELRKEMTDAETKLWQGLLRNFPFPVLRQKPLNHFIVDFYCARLKLVIEVDGDSHNGEDAEAYDAWRTSILEAYGIKVVRFSNQDIFRDFDMVCKTLLDMVKEYRG